MYCIEFSLLHWMFQAFEDLKTELEENLDATAAVQDIRAKREDEHRELKQALQTSQKQYETNVRDLKQKYQQQVDQLNKDLDNIKKVTLVVGLMIGILSHILVYDLKKKCIYQFC